MAEHIDNLDENITNLWALRLQKADSLNDLSLRKQEAWRRIKRIWGIPLKMLFLKLLLPLLEGLVSLGLKLEDFEQRLSVRNSRSFRSQ